MIIIEERMGVDGKILTHNQTFVFWTMDILEQASKTGREGVRPGVRKPGMLWPWREKDGEAMTKTKEKTEN